MEGQPLPVSTAQDIRNMYLNNKGFPSLERLTNSYAMGTSVAKSDLKTGDHCISSIQAAVAFHMMEFTLGSKNFIHSSIK